MTSATDRLRALLDERGVEWWQSANTLGCVFTRWQSPLFGDEVCAMENGEEGLVVFDHYLTPEQAVDATLGRGTCHAVFEVDAMSEDERIGEFVCSECGETFGDVRDQLPHYCPACGKRVVE